MASEGDNLTGLWFDGQKYFASTLDKDYKKEETPVLRQTKEWLDLSHCTHDYLFGGSFIGPFPF